jgi:hypothetical protein
LEGKILDYNGEKKGRENFPYVRRKEEILRTIINIGNIKRSVNIPTNKRKEKFRTIMEIIKVRKISHR